MGCGKLSNAAACSLSAFIVLFLALTGVMALFAGISMVPKAAHETPDVLSNAAKPLEGTKAEDNKYMIGNEAHDLSCFDKSDLQLHTDGIDYPNLPCKDNFARAETSEGRYTIVCNTFRRPNLLRKSIEHYSKCPNVDAFVVVWSDTENKPYEWLSGQSDKSVNTNNRPLKIKTFEKNVLSNQFKIYDEINTDAVFNVDDDVLIACDDLEFGFDTWNLHRERMVGFFPRALSCKNLRGNIDYHSGNPNSHALQIGYRMVLTKAAFYAKTFHQQFWEHVPPTVLSHIDDNTNCEDLAFSFVHAKLTGLAPIWIRTVDKIKDKIKKNAISKKRGHATSRDQCIDMFKKEFDLLPPLTTVHLTRCSNKLPWDWAKRGIAGDDWRNAPILSLYNPFPPQFNGRVRAALNFAPRLPPHIQDRIPQLLPMFIAQFMEIAPAPSLVPALLLGILLLALLL